MNYLEDFIGYIEFQRNRAEDTIRNYRLDLRGYLDWLKGKGLDPVHVKVKNLDTYVVHLRKDVGNCAATVNRKIYSIKSFYHWLLREEIIQMDPTVFVEPLKEPDNLPDFLTPQQQEAFLQAAQTGKRKSPRDEWIGRREFLMALCFLDTGVRVGELCGIEIQNIDLAEGLLRVRGKGNKQREIVLSDRLIGKIKDYLRDVVNGPMILPGGALGGSVYARGYTMARIAEELGIKESSAFAAIGKDSEKSEILGKIEKYLEEKVSKEPAQFLFSNQKGKKMGTRHLARIVKKIGKRADIPWMHCHACRHSAASNIIRRSGNLLLVQKTLGHANISTSARYTHLSNDEFRTEMRKLLNA